MDSSCSTWRLAHELRQPKLERSSYLNVETPLRGKQVVRQAGESGSIRLLIEHLQTYLSMQ